MKVSVLLHIRFLSNFVRDFFTLSIVRVAQFQELLPVSCHFDIVHRCSTAGHECLMLVVL